MPKTNALASAWVQGTNSKMARVFPSHVLKHLSSICCPLLLSSFHSIQTVAIDNFVLISRWKASVTFAVDECQGRIAKHGWNESISFATKRKTKTPTCNQV
ncbi:unnamed protein product [Pseudo-nitzschia multistriata]|uniref:Uncharacterized protein n=1 Tax=Pseudo-nitzschia multistriata TaxID=183589 RepID=A0A448YZH2_9STRA|nr:unnamed protein product [Pseudo-nitzschia multistriata]